MSVLCPTRGGEGSYPNQDQAIAIATERGADLIFLYVSDVHFLDHIAGPKVADVVEEQLALRRLLVSPDIQGVEDFSFDKLLLDLARRELFSLNSGRKD